MYTYDRNNDPKFPFKTVGYGYVFENETRAANFCKMWNAHMDALNKIKGTPAELSRDEYEEICGNLCCNGLCQERLAVTRRSV